MFLTMDDEYGLFEVTLFPDVARQYTGGFSHYGPYVVTGKVENQYDSLSVTAESIEYVEGRPAAVFCRQRGGDPDVSLQIAERHDLYASPWESS